jgi:hypothetical protein
MIGNLNISKQIQPLENLADSIKVALEGLKLLETVWIDISPDDYTLREETVKKLENYFA